MSVHVQQRSVLHSHKFYVEFHLFKWRARKWSKSIRFYESISNYSMRCVEISESVDNSRIEYRVPFIKKYTYTLSPWPATSGESFRLSRMNLLKNETNLCFKNDFIACSHVTAVAASKFPIASRKLFRVTTKPSKIDSFLLNVLKLLFSTAII